MKLLTFFGLGLVSSHLSNWDLLGWNDRNVNHDSYPTNYSSVARCFQTYSDSPNEQKLEGMGRVPPWVSGTFYRNGPAIYEWGEDKYRHFFDPTGMLQSFRIKNGEIFYKSKFIESKNYIGNKEANKIIYPELGTYGEPDWVTLNEDGTPIEDERTVKANRLQFLMGNFPTSNSLVTVMPFHGWLLSMNESPFIHLHDPDTLEIVHAIDIRESVHKPSTLFIATVTAHGMIDQDGTYWNCGVGLDTSGTIPKVGYFCYKSLNAGRSEENPFENRSTVEEILDSFRWGEVINNPTITDLSISYYHMFAMTENYLVLPLGSVVINVVDLFSGLLDGGDVSLIDALEYDETRDTQFRTFNKETMRFERKIHETDPVLMIHTFNAWETDNDNIRFDTLLTGNPDTITMFTFDIINATGFEALNDNFERMLPMGTPVRYELNMKGPGNERISYTNLVDDHEDFECMNKVGMEFPILDWSNRLSKEYDHFWATGFSTTIPDRVYHVELSTNKRWVYQVDGYHVSEPTFVKDPFSEAEDDGVVLVEMTPLYDDLRPYLAVLHGRDLTEFGRFALPFEVDIGTSFHGTWVNLND